MWPRKHFVKTYWNKFWQWYANTFMYNLIAIGIVLWLQVPHMIWVWTDPVFHAHDLPYDPLWAAIDLIEILAIISWSMSFYAKYIKRTVES